MIQWTSLYDGLHGKKCQDKNLFILQSSYFQPGHFKFEDLYASLYIIASINSAFLNSIVRYEKATQMLFKVELRFLMKYHIVPVSGGNEIVEIFSNEVTYSGIFRELSMDFRFCIFISINYICITRVSICENVHQVRTSLDIQHINWTICETGFAVDDLFYVKFVFRRKVDL